MKKIRSLLLLNMILLTSGSLHAENYSGNDGVGTDVASTSQSDNTEQEQAKSIVVTGYGVDHDAALKNALQTAVEQQVGVLVDSETLIKNDELIKNDILTASNGFVKKYDELSTSNNNGLTEVRINAEVKSQAVASKIKSLNIATIDAKDVSDVYAEAITKQKAKVDSQTMLDNAFKDILSKESYNQLLEVSLTDYKVLADKAENGKTPIQVNYKISFNYPAYEEKIKKLETILGGIGAKLLEKTDYLSMKPIEDSQGFELSASEGATRMPQDKKLIHIIKRNGEKYVRDSWLIPEGLNLPAYSGDSYNENKKSSIAFEIQDKNGGLLEANSISIAPNRMFPAGSVFGIYTFIDAYILKNLDDRRLFIPFMQPINAGNNYVYTSINSKETFSINTESLKDFEKIKLTYQ